MNDSDTVNQIPAEAQRPTVRVDLLLFDSEGQLLLVRHNHDSGDAAWSTPGGNMQKHETVKAAASRIGHQQLSLLLPPNDLSVLNVYEQSYTNPEIGSHLITFTVSAAIGPAAKAGLNHESLYDETKWSPIETVIADASVDHFVKNYFHPHPWNCPLINKRL